MIGERAAWAGKLAVAFLLFATYPSHAQMYKCVDERGVTHYSDKPRPGCKGGPVDIQPIPSVSGQGTQSRPANLSQQEADFKRRQIEREQSEAKARAALDQRCARLRREHAVLASGTRIGRLNDKGERVYMEDATRDARLGKVNEELRGCP